MGRTRAALIAGAVEAIEKHGLRRMTMGDVAAAAGVAKATLYNHFRAKPDVVSAVVRAEAGALADACLALAERDGLAAALAYAADTLSAHAALRRVVDEEPAVALGLLVPRGSAREMADDAVRRVAASAGARLGPAAVDLVCRWVLSHAVDPAPAEATREAAELVAAAVTRPAAGDLGRRPG